MSYPEISVVVLVHQPTELLTRVFKSVQWSADVVVVDNQSGINWKTYPSSFKILHWGKRMDNYSEVRNWALRQTKFDWVLFIDSDEVLSPVTAAELSILVEQHRYQAYQVLRRDVFLGQALHFGEVKSVWITRLVNKHHTRFVGLVHEVAQIKGRVGKANMILNHFAHNSISDFLNSVSSYAQLAARREQQEQRHFSYLKLWFFPIGKFLHNILIKQAWKDGWRGMVYAVVMAIHSLAVRAYHYEQTKK